MAEEARFFLRTALYSTLIGVIYWFASFEADGVPYEYDWAGTALLAFTVFATGALFGLIAFHAPGARGQLWPRDGSPIGRLGGTANRLVGFEDRGEGRADQPLAGGPEAIPTGSMWPIIAAAAMTIVLVGLIYGYWLILPGVALGAYAAWGWLTQLDRA